MQLDSLKSTLEIDDDLFEDFVDVAFSLLDRQEYARAAPAFFPLLLLEGLSSQLWTGYGNAFQAQGLFEEAFSAYSRAVLLNSYEPYPFIFAAQCFVEMGKIQQAKKYLSCCLRSLDAEDHPGFDPALRQQVEEFLNELKEKKKNG